MAVKVSDVESMKDMAGIPVHPGDRVLCFNAVPSGWTMDQVRAKIRGELEHPGVPGVLFEKNGLLYIRHSDGGTTGCDPSDPDFGVRVLTPSMGSTHAD